MSSEIEQPNEVFDPGYEAHNLNLKGLPWSDIAAQTGYPTSEAAELGAKIYLQREALRLQALTKAERLALMMARYDAQLAAWWSASIQLDDKAGTQVLRILNAQAKLLGLEEVEKDASGKGKTILVMGTEKEFTSALKEIAEKTDQSNESG